MGRFVWVSELPSARPLGVSLPTQTEVDKWPVLKSIQKAEQLKNGEIWLEHQKVSTRKERDKKSCRAALVCLARHARARARHPRLVTELVSATPIEVRSFRRRLVFSSLFSLVFSFFVSPRAHYDETTGDM